MIFHGIGGRIVMAAPACRNLGGPASITRHACAMIMTGTKDMAAGFPIGVFSILMNSIAWRGGGQAQGFGVSTSVGMVGTSGAT